MPSSSRPRAAGCSSCCRTDPRVRAAALHVEHDACEIETIEAGLDRAAEQGWRYSDPGWVHRKRQRQATGQWLPL